MKIILGLIIMGLLSSASYSKTYVVGVENIEYYPNYNTTKGKYSASAGKEILDAFAKHAGITFKYKPYPVARLFKTMFKTKNKLDFKFPDHPYWKGDLKHAFCKKRGIKLTDNGALNKIDPKCITFSHYAFQYIDGVMVKKENLGKGVKAIKKLGFIRGFTAWDYYKQIYVDKTIKGIEANDFQGLLKQISKGRISGGYMSITGGRHGLGLIGLKGQVVYDPSLPKTESGYGLSTWKHPGVIAQFNKFLKEKKNELDAIRKKYGVYHLYQKK